MAVTNPGFEDAGAQPGQADGWTLASSTALQQVAEFDSAAPEGVEDFEEEWNSNEGFQFDFDSGTSQLAYFDAALEGVEDFEEEWYSNEDFEFAFSAGVAAQFDSTLEDYEDFEEEWSGNEGFFFDFDSAPSSSASFDSGTPEPVEDFEEEWFTIYYYEWADLPPGNVSQQLFNAHGGPTFVENFTDMMALEILTSPGYGAPTPADPGFRIRIRIEGIFVGTIQVQGQREGGYQDYGDPITDLSGITLVDLPEGITNARIETVAWTSGALLGTVRWGQMETL